jgi:hypothetical protein
MFSTMSNLRKEGEGMGLSEAFSVLEGTFR